MRLWSDLCYNHKHYFNNIFGVTIMWIIIYYCIIYLQRNSVFKATRQYTYYLLFLQDSKRFCEF